MTSTFVYVCSSYGGHTMLSWLHSLIIVELGAISGGLDPHCCASRSLSGISLTVYVDSSVWHRSSHGPITHRLTYMGWMAVGDSTPTGAIIMHSTSGYGSSALIIS